MDTPEWTPPNGHPWMDTGRNESVVRRYHRLGLRLGRLVPGYVDCWTGDPGLAREVEGEPEPRPADLAAQASELAAAIRDSDLVTVRQRFLLAQVHAIRHAAERLAGNVPPFREEVAECFDVVVTPRDPGWYAARHDELAGLLPGRGGLRARIVAYRDGLRVPRARLLPAVEALTAALRAELAGPLGLPAGETVGHDVVADRPWNAFNRYLGGYRSQITLNADAGHWATGLVIGAAHEAYPGHHAEHCLKERHLVRARGWDEHQLWLVNTPQALVTEGTAELGLSVALGPGWGSWVEEVLRPLGLAFDGALAERVDSLWWQLTEARQDATLLLNDGADPADVAGFLSRWMLVDDASAEQALKFIADPLWRAYTTTYVEGRRLVAGWLAARPAGEPVLRRYRRLLTEPLLPADLRIEALAEEVAAPDRDWGEPHRGTTPRISSAVEPSG